MQMSMKKSKSIDLTSGPILKTLSELALPIMASSLLGTAYNITDMAWIGLLGSKAVAGVGVGGMYVWLSQGLVALPRMGGQVNTAQSCGRKDYKEARSYAASALQMTILFGLLFAAASIIFLDPLIGFFNLTDPEAYSSARSYMLITCGLTAQFLVFAVLVFRIFTSGLETNVLRELHLFSRFPRKFYKNIFRIGFPTAIQSMLYCMISMVLTRMVSAFGAAAIAVQRVGGQIESVSWNTADGFASALNAFTAQNFGAKKYDSIRQGYRISFVILTIWGLIITAAFVLLPRPISGLFFHDPESLGISVNYLIIIGFCEAFMAIELMTIGALSGLGMTKLCSIISIILTGARIPLAMLLTHAGMGLNGIWWALSLTSIVKGIIFTLTFRQTSRTKLN